MQISDAAVTADDVELAVRLAVSVLREAPPEAWDAKAGSLEWDCWETVEHLSDDLFAYAAQLGPKVPPMGGEVPFVWESKRPGGPANAVHANREAGPDGLLQVLEACGGLLAAMVRTVSPDVRAHHVFGASDRLAQVGPGGSAVCFVFVLVMRFRCCWVTHHIRCSAEGEDRKSGATAVQIAERRDRRDCVIEHLGPRIPRPNWPR